MTNDDLRTDDNRAIDASDLQHYPFQEPGIWLQLPGYPNPVLTF